MTVQLHHVYGVSPDVVARQVEGQLIIVPLAARAGGMKDEHYSLNDTAVAIWQRLDGQRSLHEVAADLSAVYNAPLEDVQQDVRSLVAELVSQRILVEVGRD
jgi:hypothetical protein